MPPRFRFKETRFINIVTDPELSSSLYSNYTNLSYDLRIRTLDTHTHTLDQIIVFLNY